MNLVDEKPFVVWIVENKLHIIELGKNIGEKSPPETQMGREAWLIILAERLSDNLQEVLELQQEAENYWLAFLATKTAELKEFGKPKTLLDYAKNIDCPERRVFKYLEALIKTIDTRASLTQSALRFYRNV